MTIIRRVLAILPAAALTLLTGCGQFFGPPAPDPLRPSFAAGTSWAAAVAYLRAHPARHQAGTLTGILVRSSSSGYACLNIVCRTWSGTVVLANGRAERLSSDEGDDGMASYVAVGDEFRFDATDTPVDAPSDDGDAQLVTAGAVTIGGGT